MKIKTSELTGPALRWAVATAEGQDVYIPAFADTPWIQLRTSAGAVIMCPQYENDWAQAGPILEREKIELGWCGEAIDGTPEGWYANMYDRGLDAVPGAAAGESLKAVGDGPTPLIAAMRCFVASKLGDEVDVPEELCK